MSIFVFKGNRFRSTRGFERGFFKSKQLRKIHGGEADFKYYLRLILSSSLDKSLDIEVGRGSFYSLLNILNKASDLEVSETFLSQSLDLKELERLEPKLIKDILDRDLALKIDEAVEGKVNQFEKNYQTFREDSLKLKTDFVSVIEYNSDIFRNKKNLIAFLKDLKKEERTLGSDYSQLDKDSDLEDIFESWARFYLGERAVDSKSSFDILEERTSGYGIEAWTNYFKLRIGLEEGIGQETLLEEHKELCYKIQESLVSGPVSKVYINFEEILEPTDIDSFLNKFDRGKDFKISFDRDLTRLLFEVVYDRESPIDIFIFNWTFSALWSQMKLERETYLGILDTFVKAFYQINQSFLNLDPDHPKDQEENVRAMKEKVKGLRISLSEDQNNWRQDMDLVIDNLRTIR